MAAPAALDKRTDTIREMFGAVAPRYDFLNHLLSACLDTVWRRRAAAALDGIPEGPVLDLCCGTGDQAMALRRRGRRVVAADFCLPMLARAERKYDRFAERRPHGLAGDALRLPFADAVFSGATVSFGLRNLADLGDGLAEIRRVLAPGARVAFLEFGLPRAALLRALYLFYFRRVLPALGAIFSPRGSAYGYLRDSVLEFPRRGGLLAAMEAAGFADPAWRDLAAGIVVLYTGRARP